MKRLILWLPLPVFLLLWLAPRTPLLVCYGITLSSLQLMLDLVVKSTARGPVRQATRAGQLDLSTAATVACKRLQGFHPARLFEYRSIGSDWSGYVLAFLSWLFALGAIDLQAVATASALCAATYACPLHSIALFYTGRDGNSNPNPNP